MSIKKEVKKWLLAPFDSETQENVRALQKKPKLLEDAFYTHLEFGTGGMRGLMGVGTNRINKYTLGKNSQGISQYLKNTFPNKEIKVVIAYDCRNQSQSLAETCASVFTANGIHCYLFNELRPTPELSFAVRYLKAQAGIVLTASHNPPEYNGYKVYSNDGGQLVPPEDQNIQKVIENTPFEAIEFKGNPELLHKIDSEIDIPYQQSVLKVALQSKHKKNLRIVFTPIHGTSITLFPTILKNAGYDDLHIVSEQAQPDGNFSTVNSPNPEEKEALALAVQKGTDVNADIVLGTDPDADRLGVVIRDLNSNWYYLNGNQVMVVLTEYLLQKKKESETLTSNHFIATTVVSTPMIKKIASSFNIQFKSTLTGFKWIGKLIQEHPELEFIGGGEESYGYLVGNEVRDKDALSTGLLACEIAESAKTSGRSLFHLLLECYQKYGAFKERLVSITKEGKKGLKLIADLMTNFRNNPPKSLGGFLVVRIEDYLTSISIDTISGQKTTLFYPQSNVLKIVLSEGSEIALRPSGTEPKIKFYFSVQETYNPNVPWEIQETHLDQKIDLLVSEIVPE
ncbi:MAG: phospho-sugar mutase [Flavobacteriaceae bacterium]